VVKDAAEHLEVLTGPFSVSPPALREAEYTPWPPQHLCFKERLKPMRRCNGVITSAAAHVRYSSWRVWLGQFFGLSSRSSTPRMMKRPYRRTCHLRPEPAAPRQLRRHLRRALQALRRHRPLVTGDFARLAECWFANRWYEALSRRETDPNALLDGPSSTGSTISALMSWPNH